MYPFTYVGTSRRESRSTETDIDSDWKVSGNHCQILFHVKQDQPAFCKEEWEELAQGRDPKHLCRFPANRYNNNLGKAFTAETAMGITELTPTGCLY